MQFLTTDIARHFAFEFVPRLHSKTSAGTKKLNDVTQGSIASPYDRVTVFESSYRLNHLKAPVAQFDESTYDASSRTTSREREHDLRSPS